MTDCIFCKIIAGKLPAYKVYEDDDALAFLDITPVNAGHTLVIPKMHHENFFDTPDETLAHLAAVTKKIGAAIQKTLSPAGINIEINTGKGAGQVVFHTHIHLMPRFAGDGYDLWHGKPIDPTEAVHISQKLRDTC